ncbi:MAG: hypothetical protein OHK0057_27610 [Thermoflexibacter sp.]
MGKIKIFKKNEFHSLNASSVVGKEGQASEYAPKNNTISSSKAGTNTVAQMEEEEDEPNYILGSRIGKTSDELAESAGTSNDVMDNVFSDKMTGDEGSFTESQKGTAEKTSAAGGLAESLGILGSVDSKDKLESGLKLGQGTSGLIGSSATLANSQNEGLKNTAGLGDVFGFGRDSKEAVSGLSDFKKDYSSGFYHGKDNKIRKAALARAGMRGLKEAAGLTSSGFKGAKGASEFLKGVGAIGEEGAKRVGNVSGKALPILSMISGGMDMIKGGSSAYTAFKRKKKLDTLSDDALNEGIGEMDWLTGEGQQKVEARKAALAHLKEKQNTKLGNAGWKAGMGALNLTSGALALTGVGLPIAMAMGIGAGVLSLGRAGIKKFKSWRNNKAQKMQDRTGMSASEIVADKQAELKKTVDAGKQGSSWNPLNWGKKLSAWRAEKKLDKLTKYQDPNNVAADKAKLQEKIDAGKQGSSWNPLNWGKKLSAWKAGREMKEIDKYANYGTDKKAEAEEYTKKAQDAKNSKGIGGWFKRMWYGDASQSDKAKDEKNAQTADSMLEWSNTTAMESIGLTEDKKAALVHRKFGKEQSWDTITYEQKKEIILEKLKGYGED